MSKKYRNGISSPPVSEGLRLSTPHIAREGGNDQHPIFCLQFVDGRYCITNCQNTDKARFADKIRILSQLSWDNIRRANRHKCGFEIIKRKSLNIKIPDTITEDVNIIAFRFSGLKAMIGYRDLDVFHILGFDDNFKAYDHG